MPNTKTVRRMKNSDYWAQRFRLLNDALQDKSYSYTKNLEKQYNSAIADIDKQMRAWYQRFAKNNAVSYADAQKLLTSGQLKEFKWTVEEYIKKAQESAINGAWVKELENASARVHISRLEALKLQLRQHAEMLTGGRVNLTHDAAQQAYINGYYRTAYEVQRGLGYGWSMQALNTGALEKVLSRPWTVDGRTFTARCWTDKNKLVQTVNTELTRMLATGAPPDKAIEAIVKQFGVSRANAGRLIMTESAHFAVLAQHDSFKDLDVEQYKIVETFDKNTCALCGAMDGKHFPMSEFAAGANAPPFHPWCRGCIAPYFADMEDAGRRYSRNPDTGKRELLPANTTFEEWKARFVKDLTNSENGDIMQPERAPLLSREDVIEKAKEFAKSVDYADAHSYMKIRAITNSKLGYDGLPKVVNAEEFKRLSENRTLLYRGIKDGNGKTASKILDEFKYGELWTGNTGGATLGNGVYFSPDESVAKFYSEGNSAVIKAFLSDDARIVDYRKIFQEFIETGIPSIIGDPKEDYQYIIRDLGQYAAMKGYDAIAANGFNGNQHIVVLNRTKLIVKE